MTAENAAICMAVRRFMAENRITIAPPTSGAFFNAAADALPAAAARLDPSMTTPQFNNYVSRVQKNVTAEYRKGENNVHEEVAFQLELASQYFGCIGMIDDMIGKGVLSP